MSDCFVGLDLGTSGCRAIAIDHAGRIVGQARRALPPSRHPAPEASEQDPLDWWQAVVAVLSDLAAQQPGRIRSLGVDGTSSTLLLCARDGTPCTPGLMYDDRRASDEAVVIERFAPVDNPARGPSSALAKLMWLLRHAPNAGAAAYAAHQADWINGRLGGRCGTADESNVLKLGFDPVARRWPDWMAGLPVPSRLLPRVRRVGSPIGRISAAVAGQLGLPDDVLLVAGTTDSNAATLAAGIEGPGDAVTSLGSTLVLKIVSARPLWSAHFGVYSHRIGDSWLAGGASNTGGRVLRQYFTDAELEQFSRKIDPRRETGLHFYPLPATGERFPHNDPRMAARMTPRPADRAEFLQAIFEGMADIEAQGYARLAELGAPRPRRVYSSGGGAVNEAWRAIRERRLGVPVLRAPQTEAAYGVALLARAAVIGQSAAPLVRENADQISTSEANGWAIKPDHDL